MNREGKLRSRSKCNDQQNGCEFLFLRPIEIPLPYQQEIEFVSMEKQLKMKDVSDNYVAITTKENESL